MAAVAQPFRRKRKLGELGLMALKSLKRGQSRLDHDEEKINVLQSQVRRLNTAVDRKIFQNTSAITYSNAGTITLLSTIAQGVTLADRVGLDVTPDSLVIRQDVNFTATGSVRVIFFQDRLCAGTLPTVLDVLTTATDNSNYNATNQLNKRHKILADYTVYGVLTTNTQFSQQRRTMRKINKVKYLDGTAVIGGSGSGSIFVLRLTNLAATQPTDSLTWELKFRG